MGDSNDKKINEHLPAKSTIDHNRFSRRIHLDDGRVFGWLGESQMWEDVNTGAKITDVELQNLQFSLIEALESRSTSSNAADAADSADAASSASAGYGAAAGGPGQRSLNQNQLIAGTGFLSDGTGDSVDLGFVGASGARGYTASPIVAWSTQPYLTYEDDFYVTLQAYHINDIDKVQFQLNGGVTLDVNSKGCPVPHPVWGTQHDEFYAKIPAKTMANGYNEVRAVVYPKSAGKIVRLEGRTEAFYTDGDGVVQRGTTFDHTGKTGAGDVTISRHITPNTIQEELLSGGAGYRGHNPQGPGIAAEGFYFNTNTARKVWYVDPGFVGTETGGLTQPYRSLQNVFEGEWTTAAKCKENADMKVFLKTPSGSGVSGGIHQWPRANFGTVNGSAAAANRLIWTNSATGGVATALAVEKVIDIVGLSNTPTATDGTQFVQMRGHSGGNPESYVDGAGTLMNFNGGSRVDDLNVRFKDLWFKPDFMMGGFAPVFNCVSRVSLPKLFLDGCYFSKGNTYQDFTQHSNWKALPVQTTSLGTQWVGGVYVFNTTTWGTSYICKGVKLAKHNEHILQKGDMYNQAPGAIIGCCWHAYSGSYHAKEVHSDLVQYSNGFHMRNRILAGLRVSVSNNQLGHHSYGKATRYRDNSAGINFEASRRHAYGYCYPNQDFAHVDNQYDAPGGQNMNINGSIDHFVIDQNVMRNAAYNIVIPKWYVGGSAFTPKYPGNTALGGGTLGATAMGQSGGFSGPHLFRNMRLTNTLQGKINGSVPDYHKFNSEFGEFGTGEMLTIYSGARSITWGDIFDHASSRCENNHVIKDSSSIRGFFTGKATDTTFGEIPFKRCMAALNWNDSAGDTKDPYRDGVTAAFRPIGSPCDVRHIAGAPGFEKAPGYFMPSVFVQGAESFRDSNLAFFTPLAGGTSYKNMETTHIFYPAYPGKIGGVPNSPFGVFDLSNDATAIVDNADLKPIEIIDDVFGITGYYDPESVFGLTTGGEMSGGSASGDSNRVGIGVQGFDILGVKTPEATKSSLGLVEVFEGNHGVNFAADIKAKLSAKDQSRLGLQNRTDTGQVTDNQGAGDGETLSKPSLAKVQQVFASADIPDPKAATKPAVAAPPSLGG